MKKLLSFCLLLGLSAALLASERSDSGASSSSASSSSAASSSSSAAERLLYIVACPKTDMEHAGLKEQCYESVMLRFVDDNSEVVYTISYEQAQELGLNWLNELCCNCNKFPLEGAIDLEQRNWQGQLCFPGLSAESFGLIMRLRKEGYDHDVAKFTTKSFDSFLRVVVEEGLKAGRPVLGCKTPLTLALKLAIVLGMLDTLGSSEPVPLLMELATSNKYLKMNTAEDVEIISQMAWSIARHIGAAFNSFTMPYWTYIKMLTGHSDRVNSVAFSPDGKHVASGGSDNTVRIWNVSSGACIKTLTGHGNWVNSVAFSPDGKYLASGSGDMTVRIWDVSSGAYIKTLTGRGGCVYSVAFSPDGKYLASGSHDGAVRIWDMNSDACIKTLTGHGGWVYSVAFSPDGKSLASGSYDRTVRIWDMSSGACIKTLTGHHWEVLSVTFSPDGKYLASGSYDGAVRIWDVSSGACIKTLTGHIDWVGSVAFSFDGKYLASGDNYSTVRIWDVSSGACIKTLEGHENCVSSVAFSPDGKHVASGSIDRTVRIWGLAGESSSLNALEQWHMLIANVRSPFKNCMDALLIAHTIKSARKVEKHGQEKVDFKKFLQNDFAKSVSANSTGKDQAVAAFSSTYLKKAPEELLGWVQAAVRATKRLVVPDSWSMRRLPAVLLANLEKAIAAYIKKSNLVEAHALFEKYGPELKAQSKRYDEFALALKAFVRSTGAGSSSSSKDS